jgi:hypothetical protein
MQLIPFNQVNLGGSMGIRKFLGRLGVGASHQRLGPAAAGAGDTRPRRDGGQQESLERLREKLVSQDKKGTLNQEQTTLLFFVGAVLGERAITHRTASEESELLAWGLGWGELKKQTERLKQNASLNLEPGKRWSRLLESVVEGQEEAKMPPEFRATEVWSELLKTGISLKSANFLVERAPDWVCSMPGEMPSDILEDPKITGLGLHAFEQALHFRFPRDGDCELFAQLKHLRSRVVSARDVRRFLRAVEDASVDYRDHDKFHIWVKQQTDRFVADTLGEARK